MVRYSLFSKRISGCCNFWYSSLFNFDTANSLYFKNIFFGCCEQYSFHSNRLCTQHIHHSVIRKQTFRRFKAIFVTKAKINFLFRLDEMFLTRYYHTVKQPEYVEFLHDPVDCVLQFVNPYSLNPDCFNFFRSTRIPSISPVISSR